MQALTVLKQLNASGGRKVADDAPAGFAPRRYADYLTQARRSGDVTAYRHYWELCVPLAVRDGLRSGDIYVPGSRRYADPSSYLFTPAQWAARRSEFCALTGKDSDAVKALEQGKAGQRVRVKLIRPPAGRRRCRGCEFPRRAARSGLGEQSRGKLRLAARTGAVTATGRTDAPGAVPGWPDW